MRVLIPHRSYLEADTLFGYFHTNLGGILRLLYVLEPNIKVMGEPARLVDSSLSSVLISACRGESTCVCLFGLQSQCRARQRSNSRVLGQSPPYVLFPYFYLSARTSAAFSVPRPNCELADEALVGGIDSLNLAL
jgi:hypothetical protein